MRLGRGGPSTQIYKLLATLSTEMHGGRQGLQVLILLGCVVVRWKWFGNVDAFWGGVGTGLVGLEPSNAYCGLRISCWKPMEWRTLANQRTQEWTPWCSLALPPRKFVPHCTLRHPPYGEPQWEPLLATAEKLLRLLHGPCGNMLQHTSVGR